MSKVTVFNRTDQLVTVTDQGHRLPGYATMEVDDTDPVLVAALVAGEIVLVDGDNPVAAAPEGTVTTETADAEPLTGDEGETATDPKKKSSKAKEN